LFFNSLTIKTSVRVDEITQQKLRLVCNQFGGDFSPVVFLSEFGVAVSDFSTDFSAISFLFF